MDSSATRFPVNNPAKDFRRLVVLISGSIACFGVALIVIIAFAGWTANNSAIERDRTLVQNALDQNVARVLNEQKSIAFWDDAVQNISLAWNSDWVQENFGTYLTETYGHDEIFILDGENTSVFSVKDGVPMAPEILASRIDKIAPLVTEIRTKQATNLTERVDLFGPSQANYEVLSGVLTCSRYRGHILALEGRTAVVTGITICPTIDVTLNEGSLPHVLISVAYIDEAFIEDMGRSLLLPDLRLVETHTGDLDATSAPFVTDDGQHTGDLVWTPRHPGGVLLNVVLPSVILGVLATGLLTYAMMQRLNATSNALSKREALAVFEAKHDGLSKLPNRHYFVEQIIAALAKRAVGEKILVAYIDVDRFKNTNDTLGHQAGDELVKAVALRLQNSLAPGDFLSRFGGDEFAIIHPSGTATDRARWVASIISSFDEPFQVFGHRIKVTASIGVATAPDHGRDPVDLMRKADIALYAAKGKGRDQAVLFSAEMDAEIGMRLEIESDLRDAIENDELALFYQPIVSCGTGRITGVEALLRWTSPKRGQVSPAVFIPVAEEAGLMPRLGNWVLERAFEDSSRWPDIEIAVNLSPAQFQNVDLGKILVDLVDKFNVDPERIVLEITEGLLLDTSPRVTATLKAIRELGFKMALDDFGTGYSSLNYLQSFKFDKLKIDRSFVRDLPTRSDAKLIVQAVINLGRGLGMEIIAEGVETDLEAAVMRLFGSTSMQGFLFSKAVPPEEIAGLITAFQSNNNEGVVTTPRPPLSSMHAV